MESGYYLDSFLAPLAPWLGRDDITDIWINRPGEIWFEALGGGISRAAVESLDEATIGRLARALELKGLDADPAADEAAIAAIDVAYADAAAKLKELARG